VRNKTPGKEEHNVINAKKYYVHV